MRNLIVSKIARVSSAFLFREIKIARQIAKSALVALLSVGFILAPFPHQGVEEAEAAGGTRTLWLHFTHTDEKKKITFRRNGKYSPAGLKEANWILRDWRRKQPTKMDPRLLDLIWSVYQESGATVPIRVVSGFRSKKTNSALRRRSRGVARFSQHTLGKAMDFFIPGVPVRKLREIGLRMQVGGVGYYPGSKTPFVHMDTGRVRHWPRMTPKQLAKVFPRGKTMHVSTNGRRLARYSLALAEYNDSKGKVIRPFSKSKRTAVASAKPKKKRSKPVLASLFGSKKTKTAPVLTPAPTPAPAKKTSEPVIIANKTDDTDTAPIPSRIGRVDPKPEAPVKTPAPVQALAALIPPPPRALPDGLRETFAPSGSILIASAPLPLKRPGDAPIALASATPQIISATLNGGNGRPEETSITIDPTPTAALKRGDFTVPTPVIISNKQIISSDPTRLVLKGPVQPETTKPLTPSRGVALAYATAAAPVQRPSQLDQNAFNDRFGQFGVVQNDTKSPDKIHSGKIRRQSLPAITTAPAKRPVTPTTVDSRFAALSAQEPAPLFTLSDLGINSEIRAAALRRVLGVSDKEKSKTVPVTTRLASINPTALPPIPTPSPRELPSTLSISRSLTDGRDSFSFKGESRVIMNTLLEKVSVFNKIHVKLALPKPGRMPSLFLSPTRVYDGVFNTSNIQATSVGFKGEAITVTPTVNFTDSSSGIQVTWLDNKG